MSGGLIAFGIRRGQDPEIPIFKQTGIIVVIESPDPGLIEGSFNEQQEDEFYQMALTVDDGGNMKWNIRSRTEDGFTIQLTKDGEPFDPVLCTITVSR